MKSIIIFFVILVAGASLKSYSQNCAEYILKFSNEKNGNYSKDIQSKSGLFKKGQAHKLNIVFSEGKDYLVKFYNSVPNNKVTYSMKSSSGEVLYTYDNIQIYKDLEVKEKALKEKNKEKEDMGKVDEEEWAAYKKDFNKKAKEVADLKAAILKDRNTVPSCEFSITSAVNCEIEVTLADVEPASPTSCIAVLVLSKPGEGTGFQDDAFTKAKKDKTDRDEKAKAKAKDEADAKAKAEADAKAKAEADKKKKKR
jgi:hypothetical protein